MFWQIFSFPIKVMSKFSLIEFLTSVLRALVSISHYCKQVTFQESSLARFSYFPNHPLESNWLFFSPTQFIFFSLLSPRISPEPSIFFPVSHAVSVLSPNLLLLNNPNCATWHTDFGQPHNPWKCDMYRNMCHICTLWAMPPTK